MDRPTLDAAYNNTLAVGDSVRFLADWNSRSNALAKASPQHLDLSYGPRPRNRVDFFASGERQAPLLVFIHGGYWQMRAKETFRFVAQGPRAHGIDVALIGYTLAPEASLAQIVDEVHSALTWIASNARALGGDGRRIYLSGWSAGGHLTAQALEHPAVRAGLAISGIFDLEPIRLCYLDDKLRLTEEDVVRLSPIRNLQRAARPLVTAYGDAELPELQRQSREYAAAREREALPVRVAALPGHNHFSILEELANPRGALTALLLELIALDDAPR